MKIDRDQVYLGHILEAIETVEGFIKDKSFVDLGSNKLLIDGIVRELEIIGEAANNISEEFKQKYPEIKWHLMVGMRNRLIHEYFEVDLDVVWKTVQESLLMLKKQIKNLK
ncbi:MAG: DUF86 domain-containing protein [Patescibacteria group bacterium]